MQANANATRHDAPDALHVRPAELLSSLNEVILGDKPNSPTRLTVVTQLGRGRQKGP